MVCGMESHSTHKRLGAAQTMTQETEIKRGRGRPESFPGQKTKMVGYNLPVETIELLQAEVERRNANRKPDQPTVNLNTIVDRAIRKTCVRKG